MTISSFWRRRRRLAGLTTGTDEWAVVCPGGGAIGRSPPPQSFFMYVYFPVKRCAENKNYEYIWLYSTHTFCLVRVSRFYSVEYGWDNMFSIPYRINWIISDSLIIFEKIIKKFLKSGCRSLRSLTPSSFWNSKEFLIRVTICHIQERPYAPFSFIEKISKISSCGSTSIIVTAALPRGPFVPFSPLIHVVRSSDRLEARLPSRNAVLRQKVVKWMNEWMTESLT